MGLFKTRKIFSRGGTHSRGRSTSRSRSREPPLIRRSRGSLPAELKRSHRSRRRRSSSKFSRPITPPVTRPVSPTLIPYTHKTYVPLRIEHNTYSNFNIATRLPALLEEFTYYWLQNPQRLATYAQTGSQSNSLFLSLYNTSPNGLDSFNHIHIFLKAKCVKI